MSWLGPRESRTLSSEREILKTSQTWRTTFKPISSPPFDPFRPFLSSVPVSLPTVFFSLGDATNYFTLSHRLTFRAFSSNSSLLFSKAFSLLLLLILLPGQCSNPGPVSRALKGKPIPSAPLWPFGVCSVENIKPQCLYCVVGHHWVHKVCARIPRGKYMLILKSCIASVWHGATERFRKWPYASLFLSFLQKTAMRSNQNRV